MGATGMGSLLKMLGGIFVTVSEQKAAKEKRKLARDLAMSQASVELQTAIFGSADKETNKYTRTTRRIIALIGMLNFFTISILCTLWPTKPLVTFTPPEAKGSISILWGFISYPTSHETITTITTGHITLVSIATLGAIIGFYFTPSAGGK
jgi:hypothetical protein